MTDTQAGTAVAPADGGEVEEPPGRDWGQVLDAAGIAAGVVLVLIVVDILTDGKLVSRRLHRKRGDDDQPAG